MGSYYFQMFKRLCVFKGRRSGFDRPIRFGRKRDSGVSGVSARWMTIGFWCLYLSAALPAQEMISGNAVLTSKKGKLRVCESSGNPISIKPRKAFFPQGTTWETAAKEKAFLVHSNGVAIGIDSSTQIRFTEYLQRPFSSETPGFKHEPSVSKLSLQLYRGSIVIAGNQLAPSSDLQVQLPIGSLRVKGGTCFIRSDQFGLHLFSVDANLVYYYPLETKSEFIFPGELLRISKFSAERQKILERQENSKMDPEIVSLIKGTEHASQRVLYKANENTGQAPEAVMIVHRDYFNQPDMRPYRLRN